MILPQARHAPARSLARHAARRHEAVGLRSWPAIARRISRCAPSRRSASAIPKLFADREPLVVKKASPGMGSSRIAYVMIGADSRAEAEAFCARLHAAGGDCLVERN